MRHKRVSKEMLGLDYTRGNRANRGLMGAGSADQEKGIRMYVP